MSNMSYCRFQNTLRDSRDCYDNMGVDEEDSPDEAKAEKKLIELCVRIAIEYGE